MNLQIILKNKPNFAIIDKFNDKSIDYGYIIVCFDKRVVIIKETELSTIFQLFESIKTSKIYCCSYNIKDKIEVMLKKINPNSNFLINDQTYIFHDEILSFIDSFNIKISEKQDNREKIKFLWKLVKRCICAYIIKNSYFESNIDRVEKNSEIFDFKNEKIIFNNQNSIKLRSINSHVFLLLNIENEKLYALKNFEIRSVIDSKLYCREKQNYEKIHHPFLCRCFGEKNDEPYENLVLEYIEGPTLTKINQMNLVYDEKLKIVFQIMIVLDYLHHKNLVYRDLKPNNIMLDQNKTIVLIDFDRMINNPLDNPNEEHTSYFSHDYVAPEITSNELFSYKADVYSLGKIINFVFKNKLKSNKISQEFEEIKKIINKCTQSNPNVRPSLPELIDSFYIQLYSKISKNISEINAIKSINDIHNNEFFPYWIFLSEYDNPYSLFFLGKAYDDDGIFALSIGKAIKYYSLASEKNEPKSQYNLSYIYFTGKYVVKDIKKAIYYASLAAKQNLVEAIEILGCIYLDIRNIEKSIYYFKIAANFNDDLAQYNLGLIYSQGELVPVNIEKAIHYLSIAAEKNNTFALACLGNIYFKGTYVEKNIDRAIHYFTLASDYNHVESQYFLGSQYYNGKIIQKDIDKAIYFFNLAAKQNHLDALNNLGLIYSNKEYNFYDINKAVYYFKLASNLNYGEAHFNLASYYFNNFQIPLAIQYYSYAASNNHLQSQVNLGYIYSNGKYIQKNMTKAIYYFTLAAKQNDKRAQYKLSYYYFHGIGVKKNIELSLDYLKKSVIQNYNYSLYFYGLILIEGMNVIRDIPKGIYYLTKAANQNYALAQTELGKYYKEGIVVNKDLAKAFHYLSLAANQNEPKGLFMFGSLYFNGIYVRKDIKKAMYYLNLSASNNFTNALSTLGKYYYYGIIVEQNVKRGISYYLRAVNQHSRSALHELGIIYYEGRFIRQNINIALNLLEKASKLNNRESFFTIGTIYFLEDSHKNISKAIHYYKEASSLSCKYSKNNLAIIYKNGIGIDKNIYNAIELLEEAINFKNCIVSAYNLANIYLFNDNSKIKNIDKSISLLKIALENGFTQAESLLGLAIANKYQNVTLENVKKELNNDNYMIQKVYNSIKKNNLENSKQFILKYKKYKAIDYVFLHSLYPIPLSSVPEIKRKPTNIEKNLRKNLTKEFYEGFGKDI